MVALCKLGAVAGSDMPVRVGEYQKVPHLSAVARRDDSQKLTPELFIQLFTWDDGLFFLTFWTLRPFLSYQISDGSTIRDRLGGNECHATRLQIHPRFSIEDIEF